MKKSEIIFGAMRLPIDFMATLFAFFLAYTIRPFTDLIPGVQFSFGPELLPPFEEYLIFSVCASFFLVILFAVNHLYSLKITQKFHHTVFKITFLVTVWMMFIIAYYFLIIHELFFSRIALVHIWLFSIVFIGMGRLLIHALQRYFLRFGIGKRRVLFIGADEVTHRFYQAIQKNPSYEVVGALSDKIESKKRGEVKIIGKISQFKNLISKYKIEEIIQTDTQLSSDESNRLYHFCRNYQIKYHFIPDLIRLQRSNVEVKTINEIPLISLKDSKLDGWGHIFKRLFDLVFSLIIILILTPVWLIVPFLIKIDSKGPAFYKSRRKYRHQVFEIYKFRSMVQNADHLKKSLIQQNERKGPLFKIKDDPRVTRLGAFLRKTSIDEFPQLFNVLKGDLSLVGPRPHLPEEIDQYESHHRQVFAIKPGLTGLAQISGRSNLDFEDEVKLDVYYIENWSIWLDVWIILKSIWIVIKADGS